MLSEISWVPLINMGFFSQIERQLIPLEFVTMDLHKKWHDKYYITFTLSLFHFLDFIIFILY